VFLDIDGTLVDSNEFHVEAWARAFFDGGYPVGQEHIRKQIGKGADMLIPALMPGISDWRRQALARHHDQWFRAHGLPHVQAFAHAKDFVAKLNESGLQIVLASSASDEEVQHYVRLLGIAALLAGTTSADDVERSKPAGDIFASALEKVAPTPAALSVAVGDTPYDCLAAAACGIRTIALRSGGFRDDELTGAGAIKIYDDVDDLLRSYDSSPLASE
jgi:membrane protein